MDFTSLPVGAWAALGSILSTLLLAFIQKRLVSKRDDIDWRKDYREEIKELNDRLDKAEGEVNTWRDRYYHNEEEIQTLRAFIIVNHLDPPPRVPLPPRP